MADPTTVTLLLMFFSAAPTDVPSDMDKATSEKSVAWALQSTQQIAVSSADLCNQYATKVNALVAPVATMTVRAYCLCPSSQQVKDPKTGKVSDECLENAQQMKALTESKDKKGSPGIELIGPKSELPSKRTQSK